MYYLMNENKTVAAFSIERNTFSSYYRIRDVFGNLPNNFQSVSSWIEGRKDSTKYNLVSDDAVIHNEPFLKLTHCKSDHDTFWVKDRHEHVMWEDI